jgi:hypothetical protein
MQAEQFKVGTKRDIAEMMDMYFPTLDPALEWLKKYRWMHNGSDIYNTDSTRCNPEKGCTVPGRCLLEDGTVRLCFGMPRWFECMEKEMLKKEQVEIAKRKQVEKERRETEERAEVDKNEQEAKLQNKTTKVNPKSNLLS